MTENGFRQDEAGRLEATDPDPSGPEITFHHVSLAVRHATDLWPILAGSLGGRYMGSGLGPGYGWTQLQFANGFRVEGLHPETGTERQHTETEPVVSDEGGSTSTSTSTSTSSAESDLGSAPTSKSFVSEFIERSGVGPHHLTFKVTDISQVVGPLRDAGFKVVERQHIDPIKWSEAIIRSQDAHGTMVQLLDGIPAPLALEDPPEGFPESDYDRPIASLARVVHAVKDLPGALRLYRDILCGKVLSTGAAVDGNHWVELGWGGPGRLRLLEGVHADIAEFIGDRPGRTRHLFFNFDEPSYVPGATKVASGRWVVPKEEVLGTRLVLSSSAR
ncbi:MAG: hypothetical protein WBA45_17885 [Microthrixaceae bacterium]